MLKTCVMLSLGLGANAYQLPQLSEKMVSRRNIALGAGSLFVAAPAFAAAPNDILPPVVSKALQDTFFDNSGVVALDAKSVAHSFFFFFSLANSP